MATTTPNFGWPVPTSTDLVKNGATAIEALGDAIDASMADLEGGTTGQILAKNSNTDMDFVWIANDQGDITGVTATSPLTGGGTSGAITVGILSGTTSNLGAVQLSTSTSSTSTSLAATASAVKEAYDLANRPASSNPIINSSMQVAQRGTTFTNIFSSNYTLDRWLAFRGAAKLYNVSQQVTADTTNLPFIQYCARVGRPSGNTDLQTIYYTQSIETVNSRPFAGKVVTLSFYARSGANYSAASSALTVELTTGTGTDQNMINGFTGAASPISTSATLTTTWQRFTFTSSTLSSSMTELGVNFNYTPVGTAGADDYFEMTGVQIDVGSVALPFRTAGVSYQEEVAMCQRYFIRYDSSANADTEFSNGAFLSTSLYRTVLPLQVTMRSAPTAVLSAAGTFQIISSTNITPVGTTLSTSSNKTACLGFSLSLGTAGLAGILRSLSTTSAFIELSAEL
jgi:hypothetical protein